MKIKLGVLASGRGSNFAAIINGIKNRNLDAEIKVLITDNKNANAINIAKENNIPVYYIRYDKTNRIEFEKKSIRILKENNVELVLLAGFMRILTEYFINEYRNKILNIHPSLLPAFKGLNAQAQALKTGVKKTGCTVHIVDENLDGGPIIAQREVPIFVDDTVEILSERILKEEHKLYIEAIKIYIKGFYNK
ncbi:MAG TPA: phosphoribosylglycinamide formyltransferase [bacterium]|nr:phosphoribosylglycinamide formyltransferase [bacterium]HOL47421.1 phosphoribosylglycinamide formyltransferase [bacterium]HPQ19529.1 phosphoribosylglycinamide formyltransferase [bacterium]